MTEEIQNPKIVDPDANLASKATEAAAPLTDSVSAAASTDLSMKTYAILALGIFLLGFTLLQMSQFQWLGVPFKIPGHLWSLLFLLGLALSAFGIRNLPTTFSAGDLPRRFAYPIFGIIVIVGMALRFIRADQAYWAYWGDPAICIKDVLRLRDLHYFQVTYPVGSREPLYTYVGALVWWIFPAWKALFVQRFAANIFNLAAIWFFYRLGREVSGKRNIGLVMAALCAASKPVILHNLGGMNALTSTCSLALYLWFQFRLFKKPDLSHFLQWGAALAFGLYTYNAIRPWEPFLIVTTFGWILWKEKQDPERAKLSVKVLALVFSFCYLLFYVDNMLAVFHGNPISKLWNSSVPLWAFVQIVFLGALIYGYRSSGEAGKRICGWALGIMAAGVLSHPIALHTDAAMRIVNESLLPKGLGGWFSTEFVGKMFDQARAAFNCWFVSGYDRSDMNVVGDPLFDYHAVVLILLGFIYVAVRPTWTKGFLVLCGIVGSVPYLLTTDSHSAKLLGSVSPFLLLASLFIGHLIDAVWSAPAKKHWMGFLLIFFLLGYWSWEVKGTYVRVFDKWWTAVTNDDVRVGREALEELPDKRVYLVPQDTVRDSNFFALDTIMVMLDGNPVYMAHPSNVINVGSSDKRKDVAVVVSPLSKKMVSRIKKEFPRATWIPGWQYYQKSHDETPFLYKVLIPASDIPERPGKTFQFNVVEGTFWRRCVYLNRFCLREGAVQYEDASPALNPPPSNSAALPVSADGEWVAPEDGRYTFTINTSDMTRIQVDDKMTLDSIHEGKARPVSKTVFLKKGSHHVRYSTYFLMADHFSDVTITNPGLNYKVVLGS